MAAWFADLEVTRTVLRVFAPSIPQEREWLDKVARDDTQIVWAVEFEGRLVGTTGIHQIDWPNQHGTTGTVIGEKSVWGRGIASEAMRLRTRFAFTQTTLRKLDSGYLEGNEASWRAQQKSGYREVGRRRGEYF